MILERAEIPVVSDRQDAFVEMMNAEGLILLRGADGCLNVRFGRGVENPTTYLLLIEWDSVDKHVAFTKTSSFEQFKNLVGPFFAGHSRIEHFEII